MYHSSNPSLYQYTTRGDDEKWLEKGVKYRGERSSAAKWMRYDWHGLGIKTINLCLESLFILGVVLCVSFKREERKQETTLKLLMMFLTFKSVINVIWDWFMTKLSFFSATFHSKSYLDSKMNFLIQIFVKLLEMIFILSSSFTHSSFIFNSGRKNRKALKKNKFI